MSELETRLVNHYHRLNRCNDLFDKLFRDKFFPEYEFKTGRPFTRNEYRGSGGLFTNGDEIRISMTIISEYDSYNLIFHCNRYNIKSSIYMVKRLHGQYCENNNFELVVSRKCEIMYNFIIKMYNDIYITDDYINKQNAYLFLLIFRFTKTFPFPYDVAKLIAEEILFFVSNKN